MSTSGGDYSAAESRLRALNERYGANPSWRAKASYDLGYIAAVRGRLEDAQRHMSDVTEAYGEGSSRASSFYGALSRADFDIRFRHDPARGLKELEAAIARQPLESVKAA